jgi:GTP pyrophosphokinase
MNPAQNAPSDGPSGDGSVTGPVAGAAEPARPAADGAGADDADSASAVVLPFRQGAGPAATTPPGRRPAGVTPADPTPATVPGTPSGTVVPAGSGPSSGGIPGGPGFPFAGAPTGRRVRARLARFNAPWQTPAVNEALEPLIANHRASHPKADIRVLQRAYDTAARWHNGQYRKSGDPYITHPLAVAGILAELGMDTTTLVAALLHDTIEDTAYTLEEIRADFGGEVTLLVDGVTKLDRVKLGDAAKAETIRKMVVAMAKDPRVLVIKLADRLHNMRTLTFLPSAKQEQKAKETLEILAPLAHRLGMNTIKWELEDLAFKTLFPKRFEEINRLIGEHTPQREALLRQVTQKVAIDLKSAKIKAEVNGRPKHLYSVYQKMIVRGREFADIYDLVGVRILVDTVRDCYAALGVIHATWQPVPGRFKDYIAMPKFNMYQSLHTTVIGPTGKPVEMQIRTYAMHRTAEYGIAAHWRYKETKGATIAGPPAHIDEMTWLRQLLDWQREASDPSEFLDALRFDLSSQEVYVFTPKGDVIALPTGSTPVDFAYAVHTEVGHKCIGARVNGKLVSLESQLSNGDVIEIFTSKSATAAPSQDWLGFVKSPRARTKIRQYFNKERREEAIEAGKESIVKAMRKQGLPLQRLLTSDALLAIARDLHLADVASLYAAVGESQVSAQSVVQKLVAGYGGEEGAVEDIAETAMPTRRPRHPTASPDPGVVVKGAEDVWIKLARCCTPVPGDMVFGFVTRSGGVSVHRDDCANAGDLRAQPERILDVAWKPTSASTFLVAIQVEALDRHKLLADITKSLSEEKVNILSATVTTTRDRVAVSRFSFEMADPKHLGHLLAAVRRVDGVYDAYRVTSGA